MNFNLVVLAIGLFVVTAHSSIVLDSDNGYSNIIVAISNDVPDGGDAMITKIKV